MVEAVEAVGEEELVLQHFWEAALMETAFWEGEAVVQL